MTFNAASRLRGQKCRAGVKLPGMHSVPKSAVLPYAFGVGGLCRRLLNLSSNFFSSFPFLINILYSGRLIWVEIVRAGH